MTTSTDLHFRDKIPVAILGATGCVGQKFIQKLVTHPWFDIVALCASEKSVGRPYGEAVHWLMSTPLPEFISQMVVQPCVPTQAYKIAFSGIDSLFAEEIESKFAGAGCAVISNCSHFRMHPEVPLVIGEVNPHHLGMVKKQAFKNGLIVTNPNCSVIGLSIALKPLIEKFGLEAVHVTTLQSLSGAGYPGVPSLDVIDNLIPYIAGEEEKVETEPLKIFGEIGNDLTICPAQFKISAQCNRVAVSEGHMARVGIKLSKKVNSSDLIDAWHSFRGEPQEMQLPTAPFRPIHYFEEAYYPQPRLHRPLDKEMAICVGGLRSCNIFDYKFTLLSHNTMRGAVGTALLNAELLVKKGYIYW